MTGVIGSSAYPPEFGEKVGQITGNFSRRSVLITGANGFVGRSLCHWLGKQDWRVLAAVRTAGQRSLVPYNSCVVGDIALETDWLSVLDGVSMVVHLAARVHIMNDTVDNPLAAFRAVNVGGTERLARAAAVAGVRRFVYLSSIKVNGEATPFAPYSETDEAAPLDPYGISKWEAEQALCRVAQETGLEVVIIRPPLVYGPGVGGNIRRLIGLAAKGLPLPLAAIRNQRSLLYVGNLCSALQACLERPDAAGKTYLVSDGQDVSTPELYRLLARFLDAKERLWSVPPQLLRALGILTGKSIEVSRLIDSLVVSNACIAKELEWKPPFSLQQGLEDTVEAYLREPPHRSPTDIV